MVKQNIELLQWVYGNEVYSTQYEIKFNILHDSMPPISKLHNISNLKESSQFSVRSEHINLTVYSDGKEVQLYNIYKANK